MRNDKDFAAQVQKGRGGYWHGGRRQRWCDREEVGTARPKQPKHMDVFWKHVESIGNQSSILSYLIIARSLAAPQSSQQCAWTGGGLWEQQAAKNDHDPDARTTHPLLSPTTQALHCEATSKLHPNFSQFGHLPNRPKSIFILLQTMRVGHAKPWKVLKGHKGQQNNNTAIQLPAERF